MIINNNISALNTYRQMGINQKANANAMEKLSSGLRINKAGDDAAGLAISEKMRAQVRGLDQASRNSQDGISMIQTAEGALQETHNILQRMRELATQAANDTNVEVDRNEIQKEMNALTSEINRIGNTTEFNTQNVLDGGAKANKVELGSNEAVGEAARGAQLVSTRPDLVLDSANAGAAAFQIQKGDFAININGSSFSVKTGEHNEDLLDAYANGTGDFAGLENTAEGMKKALENLKTGALGTKLSDVADVSVTENGVITITAKEGGANSEIKITDAAGGDVTGGTLAANLGLASTYATATDSFKGADGTAAVVIGNEIDANLFGTGEGKINAETAQGKKIDVTLNGETYSVTLDDTAIASGNAATANMGDEDALVAALNSALARAVDKNGDTKDISGDLVVAKNSDNALTFTMQSAAFPENGETPSVKVSGDYASTLLGGITEGKNEVGGTFNATFQIGANKGQSMTIAINDMRSQALGVSGTISGGSHTDVEGAKFTSTTNVTDGTNNENVEYSLDVSTHEAATSAIKVINNAIEKVSAQRSDLGSFQNRLEHTISNLGSASENLSAAESRIRDVDMAKEVMEMTRTNILSQASQAMLAQANQKPQSVLQLLG